MRVVTRTLTLAFGLTVCGVSGYLLYLLLRKDDDEFIDPFEKASKFKVLDVQVPTDMIKIVIGRGGKNVKRIMEQSNTRISFRDRDGGGDSSEATCMIRGTIEACNIAENLIRELIKNQPLMECEEMHVPTKCTGRIIGRDGDNIREMCMLSGCKISVDRDRNVTDQRIVLRGTKEQIIVARSLIDEVVQQAQRIQNEVEATLSRREPRLPPRTNSQESPKAALPLSSPTVERMSPVPGQPDAQFEVYVSAMVDPSRFWVQIVGPKATQLDVLVDEMTEYYRKEDNRNNHSLVTVTRGDLVAAVFQYDTKWYRAEVLNVSNNTDDKPEQAELYYVDYGDTDWVPIAELYELRTDFLKLRFQAIECFLARVDPVGGAWSLEAIDKFEEWTHVAQWQKLSARIRGYSTREKTRAKRETSPTPALDLFDVNNEQDVDIAQELVNNEYAVYKKDAELNSRATSTSNISVASSS